MEESRGWRWVGYMKRQTPHIWFILLLVNLFFYVLLMDDHPDSTDLEPEAFYWRTISNLEPF
jgi:hypothetical protein